MTKTTPVDTPEPRVQLLNKVKITRQAIAHQMTQAPSDLDVLYQLGNQQLLDQFETLLASEQSEDELKEALKKLLADRWRDIKGTAQGYCEQPRDSLNQLCLALALYIAPLPQDLEECDQWEVGEGPYFLLMPDLQACEDIALGINIHQYRLHEIILSEDGKRHIPICSTLEYFISGSAKKPIHTVFTEEQMYDPALDKANNPLTESEIDQLRNHSEMTVRLMQSLDILKDPNASFFNRLQKLADGLLEGSSHGGSGQSDNAASQANEAIVEFFDYWDGLPQEMRDHYLHEVPKLGDIFKRLRDPVSIASQGISYCVGITGTDLRYEVRTRRESLQGGDFTKLQEGVQHLFEELEVAIKRPNYTLNPVKKDLKPLARRVMDIPVAQQQQMIKQYLHLDYPNFLLYAFDQQPTMIKAFIDAYNQSIQKADIISQRASNGMSVLMIAAQSYPEELDVLLDGCLELDETQIGQELMNTTASGDSLPLLILQRRPQALPKLFELIGKLDQSSQMRLLNQVDLNQATLVMMAMESNPDAFRQLCQLIGKYPKDDIAQILQQTNRQGDTLLMMALRDYPHAVAPLMTLFNQCNATDQKTLVTHVNNLGLNLLLLALNSEGGFFQTVLNVVNNLPIQQYHSMLSAFGPTGESLFIRASYSHQDNFNAVLSLFDEFSLEEQTASFTSHDAHDNHLLLLAMLHQQTPPILLFEKLKTLPKNVLFELLTKHNRQGFTPLTLALTHRPHYYPHLVNLISTLNEKQQDAIWKQVGVNGWHLPFLTAIYAPEHLSSVMSHVNDSILNLAFNQTDLSGNSMLFQPQLMTELMVAVKKMSVEQRFRLLSHRNQQGDNLLTWVLQQDVKNLEDLFELMQDFSPDQQRSLITQRNRHGQHALTLAYSQSPDLLHRLFQFIAHLNPGQQDAVIAQLPIEHWFDLLAMACVNEPAFRTYYDKFLTTHKGNKNALTKLLSCTDSSGKNLLMIIIQNNPSLVRQTLRDVKSLTDEKAQKKIMLQTSHDGQTVLSLAEKFTPDNIVAGIQLFMKTLDKQSTEQMLLQSTMKMQSADVLISSESLEDCDAEELFIKLSEQDEHGNNLLGQMVIRMPHRLPALIEKMTNLLSTEQIRQLLAHQNQSGLNLYWLALEQPQAAYLCHQIQTIINGYGKEAQMTMLAPPEGQSMIDHALKYGKGPFISTMCWLETLDEEQRTQIVEQFWQHPSEQFLNMVQRKEVDVCYRLIRTTAGMTIEDISGLMRRNREALTAALTSGDRPMKGMMIQWLLTLPQVNRFDVLSHLSVDAMLALLDDEELSLIDALPLDLEAQLLEMRGGDGQSVLVKAFVNHHRCCEKLIDRLTLFTPEQQARLLLANEGQTTLLHILANNNRPLFARCLNQLRMLSSETQAAVLSQVDHKPYTVLDYLHDVPDLYEQVLDMYASLGQTGQIQLLAQQTGVDGKNLLLRTPIPYRRRVFDQFKRLAQSAQIEILLSMNDGHKAGLMMLMEESPELQFELLDIIQSFPKHIQGALCLAEGGHGENLIHWLINSRDENLRKQAISLMAGLAKNDITTLFMRKNRGTNHNFLQSLAYEFPRLYGQVFDIFMTLPVEQKVEILVQQNADHKSLFSNLVDLRLYDQFEALCEGISHLPGDEKARILSSSGVVPVDSISIWRSLVLYEINQSKNFINLLNNKACFEPMFHLLQTLPPDIQVTILTNRSSFTKTVIDEINEPEQSKLRLVLKQAQMLMESKQLLDKMASNITNEDVHSPESQLHQQLTQRLDSFQNSYHKSIKHIHDLGTGLAEDIETMWPQIDDKLTYANMIVGILKLAACLLMPVYGAYKAYEKATTNRNVIFQTDREKIIYRLEDLAGKVEQSASEQLALQGKRH